jgi:hypothetical protein
MKELEDLRAVLHQELQRLEIIDAFVYEVTLGANPSDPEKVSLLEVEQTDVFVLVIGDSYGEITEREYDRARELGKPCLVYERLGRKTGDVQLERFITKLSGARGVPSRTTFRTAADLAEKVGKDIQGWLIREYRRVSAQLKELAPSQQADRLQGSLKRLAGSTSQLLPAGNSSDFLAWQLRQWFEALEYPLDLEPEIGPDYVDLAVRVPARRKRFTRTLVRAKDGEIRAPDVELARNEAAQRSFDEVWLISLRRITPAARAAVLPDDVVVLYTLDELIEEDVNFDRYFEWLDTQVQVADIDRLYVPLAVTVKELDASGGGQSESTYEDIARYVDQWLEDSDGEHLSLLGEFGTGKSWFALKYAHDMVTKYREAQERGLKRPRLPLVVRLREYARGFKDVGGLLTDFIFREHDIGIQRFAALETLNRMGRLLFIFDGFDEMAARVDQQKMVDNFWSLASVLGPGSKAILTCRSEYFRFAQEARELLSGKLRAGSTREILETTRFQVATLLMFDEPRLRRILSVRGAEPAVIEAVITSSKLFDLARRPVMIDLLLEAMPDLESDKADLAQVYYRAVKRKMERDIGTGRTFTSMADKIFFMCEISWEMLSTQQLKMNFKQIPDRIRAYFGTRVGAVEVDHWRTDLLSQTMLVRDDDGNYRPAHKSLIEFFSAYKLSAALGALEDEYIELARLPASVDTKPRSADQTWSTYFRDVSGGRAFTQLASFVRESPDELAKTWGRLVLDDSTSELLLLLSKRDTLLGAAKTCEGKVASRTLEVAAFGGDLQNVDLSGARLEGARLRSRSMSRADLSGSTWTGGELEAVSFDGASLRNAYFENVRLADVTFRGTDLSGAYFEGSEPGALVNVVGGTWCTRGSEEILLVVVGDGRWLAICPLVPTLILLSGEGKTGEALATWLVDLRGQHQIEGIGDVLFTSSGMRIGNKWTLGELAPGLKLDLEPSYTGPAGEVERLAVRLIDDATKETIFISTFYDPTSLPNDPPGSGIAAISKDGRRLVTVSGRQSMRANARIEGPAGTISLADFNGSPYTGTEDRRGALFSPSQSLLAIRERSHAVGIWRTDNGGLVCRIAFQTPTLNSVTDAATGLPSGMKVSPRSLDYEFEPRAP